MGLMKRARAKDSRFEKSNWSENQRLQCAVMFCTLGNLTEVSRRTGIPYDTMREWKHTDWWKELLVQIQDEELAEMDANLRRVATKALKATEDRLEAGDWQYDPKTGKPIRIPVKANIALKITTDLLRQSREIRAEPKALEIEKTIDERLAKLSAEFARFAGAKTIEVETVVEGETVVEEVENADIASDTPTIDAELVG